MSHDPGEHERPPGFWTSRHAIGWIIIGAVAGYFLLTEHLAHAVGALPYLLLLACPLMHLFMHHGHGRHGGPAHHHGDAQAPKPSADQKKQGKGEAP